MTDSVRCAANSRNSFICEVQLDSELEQSTCETAEPPPPASNPAVSSLVSSFVSKTVVPAPPAPLISGAALLACASSELSIVLAAGTGKHPLLAALSMLKAAFDASTCLTLAHNQAAQRNAESYCTSQGGVVLGVEGEKTICEVREAVK